MFLQETVLGAISAVVFFSLSVTLANSYSSAGVADGTVRLYSYSNSSLISAGQAASVRNLYLCYFISIIHVCTHALQVNTHMTVYTCYSSYTCTHINTHTHTVMTIVILAI